MKLLPFLSFSVLLAMPFTATAQDPMNGGGLPPDLPPEMRAASIAFTKHFEAAKKLRSEGKLEEALSETAKAMPYIFKFGLDTYYPLAQEIAGIYLDMGEPYKALEAYKDGYPWLGETFMYFRDRWPHDSVTFQVQYGLLLAKHRGPEAAQMLYYSELLAVKTSLSLRVPPCMVVFEPDPVGDYWEYSENRYHAVMLMLDILFSPADTQNRTRKASELFPEWYYPYMVRASKQFPAITLAEREQLLDTAYAKARTDQERQWVENVRSVIRLDPKLWTAELEKFGKLWPDALNSVHTYQTKWAELRANWRDYGVERAQMFANGN